MRDDPCCLVRVLLFVGAIAASIAGVAHLVTA